MPTTMKELRHRWGLDVGVGLALLACGQATSAGGSGQDASAGPGTAPDSGGAAGATAGLEGSGAQAGASSGTGGTGASNGTGGTSGPVGGNGGNAGGSTPDGSGGTATTQGTGGNLGSAGSSTAGSSGMGTAQDTGGNLGGSGGSAAGSGGTATTQGTGGSLDGSGGSTQGGGGTGAAASGGAASGQVCDPGALVCDGDTATVCRQDGTGYQEGGVDCVMSSLEDRSATGQLCASGECVPYVRYNFQGDPPYEDASAETQSLATFFSVTASTEARLLRLAHPLSIRATTSVTFDVFESSTEEGPYQRLVSSAVTFDPPGILYHSAPMDVQLRGGYFYAFVISWESSMPVGYRVMKLGYSPSQPIVASATLGSPPGDSLALPEPADEIYYTHYFMQGP